MTLRVWERCPAWSPDSLSILITRRSGLFVVPVAGGPAIQILLQPGITASAPVYSRDGQSIYFTSGEKPPQIFRVPASGGAATQITSKGGYNALPSPDGYKLLFTRREGNRSSVYELSLASGGERRLFESGLVEFGRTPVYLFQGGQFFVMTFTAADDPAAVDTIDPMTGKLLSRLRLPIPQRFTAKGFAVSPDRKWLVYPAYEMRSDLMRFEHFR